MCALRTQAQEETARSVLVACAVATIALPARALGAQTIGRVSPSSAGAEPNGHSCIPLYDGVTADGRFVVFESDATNRVPADDNALRDVFVRDRFLGTTTRVSEALGRW